MPSADQHRSKAERNRRFLDSINLADFPEWVVVAAFYTAVHLIERCRALAGDGDSSDHKDRLEYVQFHFPADIHGAYRILYTASMLARYDSMKNFYAQFQPEDVAGEIVASRLARIERFVAALPPP